MFSFYCLVIIVSHDSSRNKMASKNSDFPEFVLEKEFQCHNTALIKDVVCKTIQKFVKRSQDVRLSITVSFQPHITGDEVSHEQEAVALIQVDKPGNFYPGGQEQRIREKELEMFRKTEADKRNERREMRKLAREEEERKRRKTEQGVKRPSGAAGNVRMTRMAPPLPYKAEVRQLPTGEMYAVRERIYTKAKDGRMCVLQKTPSKPLSPIKLINKEKLKTPVLNTFSPSSSVNHIEKKIQKLELRKPATEEMEAMREIGERDDDTDRDGFSLEAVDIISFIEPQQSTTSFTPMPSNNQIDIKKPTNLQGSIKLEDDGKSSNVLAYIDVHPIQN